MAFLSGLSPVPSFPKYSGPYTVGTCDAEIAAQDLASPSDSPDNPKLPGTVAFRIFYPCDKSASSESAKPVRWLPSPQSGYLSAYTQFLGANSIVGGAVGFLPSLLDYTTIPALRNAPLLAPSTKNERWPVMMFSHGLGGSRNAYSYIVGNLASHGIVVIAPDHRDESSPISYIRQTSKTPATTLGYKRYSHNPSPEVYQGRDEQLKIRLWEMGLIHDAVLRIDRGEKMQNLDPNSTTRWRKNVNEVLGQFSNKLHVQQPGSIVWAGHSFGACTTVQLVKSAYYRVDAEKAGREKYTPLFSPRDDSSLVKQITPQSSVILLDIWCLPLRSPSTRWLWEKPMPQYKASGSGGKAILSVFSEHFYKWTGNLNDMKRVLAPPTSTREPPHTQPHLFYPATSAHLSQSDFGILFPWLLKRFLKVQEPERIVKLNVRAALQVMRDNGLEVADTSALDREEQEDRDDDEGQAHNAKTVVRKDSAQDVLEAAASPAHGQAQAQAQAQAKPSQQDPRILSTTNAIRGWIKFGTEVVDERITDNGRVEDAAAHVEDESKPPADLMVDEERIAHQVEI